MGNSDHGPKDMRVGGGGGGLRPWHYIYVYSIESRLIRTVIYESKSRWISSSGNPKVRAAVLASLCSLALLCE